MCSSSLSEGFTIDQMPWGEPVKTHGKWEAFRECPLYTKVGNPAGTAYMFSPTWRVTRKVTPYSGEHYYAIWDGYNNKRMVYYDCPLEFLCAVQGYSLYPQTNSEK